MILKLWISRKCWFKYLDSFLFNNEKTLSDDYYGSRNIYQIGFFAYLLNQNRPEVINGYQAYFDEKMLSFFQPDLDNILV